MMEHGGMRSAWERSSPKTRSPARLHECPHAMSCGRWLASWASASWRNYDMCILRASRTKSLLGSNEQRAREGLAHSRDAVRCISVTYGATAVA